MTQIELHRVLDYDALTGALTWEIWTGCGPSKRSPGDPAGTINSHGYRIITMALKKYQAHRLAWLWMTGAYPPADIDHINGRRDDNRWKNLRAVTRSENLRNQKRRNDNKSGVTGVSWSKQNKKWGVITIGAKHLGHFSDKAELFALARRQNVS